jgi:hypothetical protein
LYFCDQLVLLQLPPIAQNNNNNQHHPDDARRMKEMQATIDRLTIERQHDKVYWHFKV